MNKYLVLSWSDDSQSSYWDYIMANQPENAALKVAEVRDDYSTVVEVFELKDLQKQVQTMQDATPEQIESWWQETIDNHAIDEATGREMDVAP